MTDIQNEFDIIAQHFLDLKNSQREIASAVRSCIAALKAGNKIMFCGNGGSASQSQHLAAELVGRYKIDRPAMSSVALTVDTSILTAVGNDYGYADVFCRQVDGIGCSGDVLFGLSTSGNSDNVVRAFEAAKKNGITTIALTGAAPGRMAMADITITVPSQVSCHIQEMHLAIGHWICGEIESSFYGS
ncbi:MAG: D-sedoheptulose-7-phosphate isomerase [Thermoguttaceae bacterium]